MPQIPTDIMLLNIAAIVVGLAALAWSSDKFIFGASNIAKILGISPLIIGITIVGFGTSAPEILVSAIASFQGKPSLAVGNAIGSNIANITLVLGITAIIIPVLVKRTILTAEMAVLIAIMFIVLGLMIDNSLSRTNAIVLLLMQIAVLVWMIRKSKKEKKTLLAETDEEESNQKTPTSTLKAAIWLIIGLAILLLSSKVLVWGAENIARELKIPELVIGLTIVALGTSLPELAACIAAVRNNHSDIAIGNILGSNIFNILSVLGIAAIITPVKSSDLGNDVLNRDFPTMIGTTILLLAFSFSRGKDGSISRIKGILFFIAYAVYQFIIISGNTPT